MVVGVAGAVAGRLPAVEPDEPIQIQVDGRLVRAYQGETVAAVLVAEGIATFRQTAKHGSPRGLFCGMGICFDCLVTIDGVPNQRACLAVVAPAMSVETGATR
jgi:D-hydroxyproline dehydrogenase subunit gamma